MLVCLYEYRGATYPLTSVDTRMTGFIIVFAKMSDVYGRKSMLLTTTILFTIFSAACGASQTMDQLQVSSHFLPPCGDFQRSVNNLYGQIESSSELSKALAVPVTSRFVR